MPINIRLTLSPARVTRSDRMRLKNYSLTGKGFPVAQMNRNYLISLAAAKVRGWAEYLQRPSPAHPLSFMGADAIWSAVQAGGGGLGTRAGGTHRARTAG